MLGLPAAFTEEGDKSGAYINRRPSVGGAIRQAPIAATRPRSAVQSSGHSGRPTAFAPSGGGSQHFFA